MHDRRLALARKTGSADNTRAAGVVTGTAGTDHDGCIGKPPDLLAAAKDGDSVDAPPMLGRVVVEITEQAPLGTTLVQSVYRLGSFASEAARSDDDEIPPAGGPGAITPHHRALAASRRQLGRRPR